jgi:hypothetical protein
MKKIFRYLVMILLGLVLFLNLEGAYAQQDDEKPEPLEPNGTTWGIQLTYTDPSGKQTISEDLLIFEDLKFNSEGFRKEDYNDSNYTLSSLEDGATVFETMQTKDEDKVFWRGEIREKGIRGIVSVKPAKGMSKDYNFVGGLASGELAETRKARKDREAAEKAAKEAAEKAARQAELVAQNVTDQSNVTETEQSFSDKIKEMLQRIKGSEQKQQTEAPQIEELEEQQPVND